MDPTRRRLLTLIAGSLGLGWLAAACRDALTTATSTPTPTTPGSASVATTPTTTTTAIEADPAVPVAASTPQPETLWVIGREGWSSRSQGEFRTHEIERITIHHTAAELTDNRLAPKLLRQHEDWHMSHGWPGLAYHFVVDRNGNVYEGRPVDAVGDTFTDYDPTGHFLPAYEGHFDLQQPSSEQLAAMATLVAWAMQRFGIPESRIAGHRDWAATGCPGDNMYWRLPGLARTSSDHEPIELDFLRGGTARARVEAIFGGM